MYHYYGAIKSRIMGYKKSQVDQYIKEQLYHNSSILSELSLRVIKLEGDKKQLEIASSKLKLELMSYYDENLPVNLFADMYETIRQHKQSLPAKVIVRKVVDSSAASEVNSSIEVIKQELGALSNKVDSISESIAKMMLLQSSNVTPVATTTSGVEAGALSATSQDHFTPTDMDPSLAVAATIESSESAEITASTISNPFEEFTATSVDVTATTAERIKVEAIEFYRDAINSKKADNPNQKSEKGKVVNFNRINTAIAPSVINHDNKKKQVNSFFGVAVNESPGTPNISLNMNARELLEQTDPVDSLRMNSFFEDPSRSHANTITPRKYIKSNPDLTKMVEQPRPVVPQAQPEATSKIATSAVPKTELNEDAKYIRQKYIVGKLAGDDLYDRNGKLIIGRRSVITPAVVEYADKEGKLPELIVHMILRDME